MLNRRDVKVLIMQGDLDYYINYFGSEKVIKDLNWYGKKQLQSAMTDLSEWSGGLKASVDNFTYLRVKDSGLKIYQEKPELMYKTLKEWI